MALGEDTPVLATNVAQRSRDLRERPGILRGCLLQSRALYGRKSSCIESGNYVISLQSQSQEKISSKVGRCRKRDENLEGRRGSEMRT